jgi:hypothetical protein
MRRLLHTIRKHLRALGLPLLLLTFVLGVYLAAGNVLLAASVPDKKTWAPWTVWFVILLVSAVWVPVYALYQTVQAQLKDRAQLKTQTVGDLVLLCQRIVAAIAHGCVAVSVNELAACVWLCRTDGRFNEIARFFLPHERPPIGVEWHKGKGVAGWAWAVQADLLADLRPLIARRKRIGAAKFDALPEHVRFGLSAAELDRTRKYTGVVAIQLFSTDGKARLLGMLILDYVGDGGFDCIAEQAQSLPVTTYTGACAKLLTEAGATL